MKDNIYLYSYKIFKFIAQRLPPKFLNIVASIIYILDKKHRTVVKINLDMAFGNTKDDNEKEIISKSMYRNLIYNLADFAKNQDIDKKSLLKKVSFKNEYILENLIKEKKKVILITAHYGNWELLSLAISSYFKPFSIVGRDLDSKVMNEVLKKNREQFGVDVISKRGAMRKLLKVLKENKLLGLLVDQNTSSGIEIDFFGKKAMHTHSVSLLAKKMNATIVPVFITTTNHKEYLIKFYEQIEPIFSDDHEDDILKLTQAQADITQYIIQEKPDEYFWLHKRWKNTFKELYL